MVIQNRELTHTRALLWKNYLLKKKHPIKWALEMLLPVAFILLLGGLKTLTDDVRVPDGWSDTNPITPDKKTFGTSYNLFAPSSINGSIRGLQNVVLPKFYATETSLSGILLYLASKSYQDGKRLDLLSPQDKQMCQAKLSLLGMVSLNVSSPFAVPKECGGRVVPYKIAIIPDNTFTRQYFAKAISKWYPNVPLSNATIFGTPTIPSFEDSIVFYNSESELESYVSGESYGADLSNPKIHSAIVFQTHPDGSKIGSSSSIEYTLRLNSTQNDRGVPGDVPRSNLKFFNPLQKSITLDYYPRYALQGFMTLQTLVTRFVTCLPDWTASNQSTSGICQRPLSTMIATDVNDKRLLKQLENDISFNLTISAYNQLADRLPALNLTPLTVDTISNPSKQLLLTPLRQSPQPYYGSAVFPFPIKSYINSGFYNTVSRFFALIFMISYLYALSSILVSLIKEKETKAREIMKILGVRDSSIIVTWYITYGMIFIIAAILQALASMLHLFPNSSFFLVFVFFLLFGYSILAYAFLVSTFFSKSKTGAYVGIILFFVMYLVSTGYSDSTAIKTKNISCLLSPVALAFGAQTLANAEGSSVGITFSNANDVINNFQFNTSLYFLMLDTILYTILGIYFEKVIPKEYGTTEKWYFFVMPSYWAGSFKTKAKAVVDSSAPSNQVGLLQNTNHGVAVNGNSNQPRSDSIEPVSFDLKQQESNGEALQIVNLGKVFKIPGGEKVAVHGLNLTMYKHQITCLLGHNGAGKTTLISMLTGMIPCSSGDAYINNGSFNENMSEIRNSLGICPQHDVLYEELTVEEHLLFYGRIKGLRDEELRETVNQKIIEVGLTEKTKNMVSGLSGGMKRKLSLAIALLGDNEIVFLDEPTSGMDPYSRRSSWEIIMNNRLNRIIVLTTHFMDEADILGDRIAIMAEGELRCCGSSLYLKNKYGAGYHLSFVKQHETCSMESLIQFLKHHIPATTVLSNVGSEIAFQLPFDSASVFGTLFHELDENLTKLEVVSYGISVTTLEEVFIKVAEIGDLNQQHTLIKSKQNSSARNIAVATNGTGAEAAGIENGILNDASSAPIQTTTIPLSNKYQLFWIHFKALIKKRFHVAKRDKRLVLFGAFFPILYLTFGMMILKYSALTKNDPNVVLDSATLPNADQTFAPYYCTNGNSVSNNNYCESIMALSMGANFQALPPLTPYTTNTPTVFDVTYTVPPINQSDTTGVCLKAGESMFEYGYKITSGTGKVSSGGYVIYASEVDRIFGYNLMINTSTMHAAIVYKSMIDQSLLRFLSSNATISLKVNNHPLPLTNSSKTLFTTFMSFVATIFIVIAFAYFTASIVPYLVNEKNHLANAKHQQFVSGVNIPAFWISNYVWDLCIYTVPCAFAIILIYAFDITPFTGHNCNNSCAASAFWSVIVLFIFTGFAICSFSYIMTFLLKDPSTAQTYTIMVNIGLGVVLITVSQILDIIESTISANKVLKFFWRLSPLYNLGNGLNNLSVAAIQLGFGLKQSGLSAFSFEVAGYEVLYLCLESLIFPIIAIGLDYAAMFPSAKYTFKRNKTTNSDYSSSSNSMQYVMEDENDTSTTNINNNNNSNVKVMDKDVYNERERVLNGLAESDVVLLKELRKVYDGHKVGVENLTLGLQTGDCFGYLGINGAGKTTTMKMLTGNVKPTSGNASLNGFNILTQSDKIRRLIGYCPQFDALIDLMTVKEHLEMFAAIKGIVPNEIDTVVEIQMKLFNLVDFKNKLAGTLSGGNKRKLSVAIAMINKPKIVFLDEPSTGMDPVSRRFMWDVISDISTTQKQSTIILTTHSMEECEALCNKVGIMVSGQLQCLGNVQHLKSRFGDGYMLNLKLKSVSSEDMALFLSQYFNNMNPTVLLQYEDLRVKCTEMNRPDRFDMISSDHMTGFVLHEAMNRYNGVRVQDFSSWFLLENQFDLLMTHFQRVFDSNQVKITLLERQNDTCRFQLTLNEANNDVNTYQLSLGNIFTQMETLKAAIDISEYSVSQTSLEQIFNMFACQQKEEINVAKGMNAANQAEKVETIVEAPSTSESNGGDGDSIRDMNRVPTPVMMDEDALLDEHVYHKAASPHSKP